MTYAGAGVDIAAGEAAVKRIRGLAAGTHGPEVLEGLGGFGGLYDFSGHNYRQPVLVASTDGVGTKLRIAFLTGRHDTVGQDIVNHCVNDILATGAVPLFFLDYFATSVLDGDIFEEVVGGMALACRENGCALLGGETAEMPGFYQPGEYDLSGTVIGVAEKDSLLASRAVERGNLLVGVPSTGLHTNGYSLARKVLLEEWDVADEVPELGMTIGAALLQVHRSYLSITTPLLDKAWLRGLAHITGGGLEGNLGRIIARDQALAIDWDSWKWPPIFRLIQESGHVPLEDMRSTFNLGVGWVFVIDPGGLAELQDHLGGKGENCYVIGEVR